MLGFEGERQDINGKVIQFVDQLQVFSNKKLIELCNYLKMQNREAYKWTMQKVILANWGKFFYLF